MTESKTIPGESKLSINAAAAGRSVSGGLKVQSHF